ncbi:MAG TPA: SpoIID/LytB domain-containing protein [Desulfobacteria bacterium]|nr:SpoIID/LytB domain-containing protein [Desulfobacteria bacterium]
MHYRLYGKLLLVFLAITLLTFLNAMYAWAGIPENVRVGIITNNAGSQFRNASTVTFKIKGQYNLVDLSAIPGLDIISSLEETETWQIYYLPSGIQIYRDGQPVKLTTGPIVLREKSHGDGNQVLLKDYSVNGSIKLVGRWYRGDTEFRSSDGSLVVVNELPMEEYLYAVVPREMSNSWPLEALKAQAVAARTYTVVNYNKRIAEGFNVLDTPSDQAYGGAGSEGPNATSAVQGTAGQIITYNGLPISSVYHSTSGGHTESNENAWGTTPMDYLRGKPDPYSTKNGLANWSYSATTAEIRNRLLQSGSEIGLISSISLEKYNTGRVKNVIINDTNGNTIKKSGSAFGKLFNPNFYTYVNSTSFMSNYFEITTDFAQSSEFSVLDGSGQLKSASGEVLYGLSADGTADVLNQNSDTFDILGASETITASKAPSGSVTFEGHGWGHGVGMSQWGAYEMARQGKNYDDILKFYYTGVDIKD